MATAATIINRALRLLGAISSGASADTDEMADGLIALNAMIDSWNNERLMIYAIQDESLTLVDGQASYTIGTSGNLNTTRPVSIEGAYVRASSLDYPVRILNEQLGPAAEGISIKLEKVKAMPELRPLLVTAAQLLLSVRGAAAAQAFADRFLSDDNP